MEKLIFSINNENVHTEIKEIEEDINLLDIVEEILEIEKPLRIDLNYQNNRIKITFDSRNRDPMPIVNKLIENGFIIG